ncbi:hypothetical protein ACFL47_00320 [Candidatus Latescibacterota bacterium]
MPREVMERRASDNTYLHKDFHGALSTGIEYLHTHFGEEAVREYLRRFAVAYYSPLIMKIRDIGLSELKSHIEHIYSVEGWDIDTSLADDVLTVTVKSCPAVIHMREKGYSVARLFIETTKTVNDALCMGSPYQAELVEYDEKTGGNVQRFTRRAT